MAGPGLVALIQCSRPDLVLVASDGQQSYTWRLLLALHSPWLSGLLSSSNVTDCGLSCLSLPALHTDIQRLLAHISTSTTSTSSSISNNPAAALLRLGLPEVEESNKSKGKKETTEESDVGGTIEENDHDEPGVKDEPINCDNEDGEDSESGEAEDTKDVKQFSFLPQWKAPPLVAKWPGGQVKSEEEVGDREVQFIEKRLNTGRKTMCAYMDWKYQYNCNGKKRANSGWMQFACVQGLRDKYNPDRCRSHLTVRKTFSESEGVTYRAEKLTGGRHNHGEMRERVMVDYAKHRLKLLVTQKEWHHKSFRQIYMDFVESFPADMEEEGKSLFSVVFPSFSALELPMRRWRKSI